MTVQPPSYVGGTNRVPVGDACYTGGAGLLLMWKENAPACAWGGCWAGRTCFLYMGVEA